MSEVGGKHIEPEEGSPIRTHAPMQSLAGQVAIVTGGAQGIGESIARFFAEDGASVLIADIQAEKAEDRASAFRRMGLDVRAVDVDIRSSESAERMVSRALDAFGHIDVLVNNAGWDAPLGLPWEISTEHWREVLETDLSGAWYCTQAVLPHFMERRAGRVIFISSTSARIPTRGISVAYNAAKAGLIGLMTSLSMYLEPYGILVNAIAAGATGTTGRTMTAEERRQFAEALPLGVGGPSPIAEACLYLARDSGSWISGAVMNVSGGGWRGF